MEDEKPKRKRYGLVTLEERKIIEHFIKQGLSSYEIAKRIGRCRSCICRELNHFSPWESYDVEKAQNRANQAKERRRQQLRKSVVEAYRQTPNIDERLSTIEMQIEIILEQLEKLHARN